jgi:hypothetical protein
VREAGKWGRGETERACRSALEGLLRVARGFNPRYEGEEDQKRESDNFVAERDLHKRRSNPAIGSEVRMVKSSLSLL